MQILVVEDELRLQAFVTRALRADGWTVEVASDGRTALARALAHSYDLVLLDVRVPDFDGLELLSVLGEHRPGLPVLVLSAHPDLGSKLRAFQLGAVDYLTKPFALDELRARVRVHTRRRAPAGEASLLRAGAVLLDLARLQATVGSTVSELTGGECRLLRFLVEHAGEVLSREQLLSDVWGCDFDPRSNRVDASIRRLRRKLGPEARIETVRNVGYRLAAG